MPQMAPVPGGVVISVEISLCDGRMYSRLYTVTFTYYQLMYAQNSNHSTY
jgi:hypothetical protein